MMTKVDFRTSYIDSNFSIILFLTFTAKIYVCHISDIKGLESLYNCKARADKASPGHEKDIMRSLL